MASIIPYKGITSISFPDPSGNAGLFVQNNFRSLTDSILIVSGLISSIPNAGLVSGYVLSKISALSGYDASVYNTIANSISTSGYLDSRITFVSGLIGGGSTYNQIPISGYLLNQISNLSGYVNTQYNTITNTSSVSGYLNSRDLSISGYIENKLASYYNNAQIDNISGYLGNRIISVSGYTSSTYATISNTTSVSGYLQNRDTSISGYLMSQLANYATLTNLSNTSGYLANQISILSGVITASTAGSSVSTDASLGDTMDITATASFTLNNPTNSTNGKRFLWRILGKGGTAITVTLGGNFRYGSDITSLTTIASGTTDYIGCIYNTNNSVTKWDITSYVRGF